jgi:TctA family transporter
MLANIEAWFKGFWTNIVAEPVSSIKGLLALCVAGFIGYSIFEKTLPLNALTEIAIAYFIVSGIYGLGTPSIHTFFNNIITKIEDAASLEPKGTAPVGSIADQLVAMKSEALASQAKYQKVVSDIAIITEPSTPKVS